MKRIALFEFEDFKWLPTTIRSGVTNLIKVFHRMIGTKEVLHRLIEQARKKVSFTQVVDMGSGSGGPMPDVIRHYNEKHPEDSLSLLLSDKYPSPAVVTNVNKKGDLRVSYYAHSVDAREVGQAPDGLKTMIASFHHMEPDVAEDILRSAEENQEPILIYELAQNNVPVALWWLLLPISLPILIVMTLLMTPFVRPLNPTQLLFTYLVPVIPLVYTWDGQASLMRTYTFADLKELIGERRDTGYVWEIADATNTKGKKAGYYVFGYPVET